MFEQYEDLITWARDDLQKEARALDEARNRLAKRGLSRSGALGHALREVRDEYARRWRDRKRAAERALAEIREAEGASVIAWRRLRRRPLPDNPYAEELAVITAGWEDEDKRREAVELEVRGT